MSEIRVGVVGFGLGAKVFHAPFVSAVPGLRLTAIVERSSDQSKQAYPETRTLRSIDALVADPEIDLVVVTTPNETHFDFARKALEAGKHVVIDKPFAATSAEAHFLIELADAQKRIVAPFHNRRWDGDFLTVKKIIGEGTLGRIVTIESHFDRYRPLQRENTWKEAGNLANGLLMDLGPHLLDQAVALFGVPRTITASVRTDRDTTAIEDAFDICLGYDRLLYWARSSMVACDASPRFLLHGTNGSYKKFGLDPQEPALVAGAIVPHLNAPDSDRWLDEAEEMWGTLTVAPNLADPGKVVVSRPKTERGDYRHFYTSVRDAILGTGKLGVPAEAGFAAVKLIELARVSSAERRTIEL
jgi:predicted dehydrogenase